MSAASSPDPLAEIRNYLPLTPRLTTSGKPTAEQFALIRDAGFDVLINLLPENDAYSTETEEEIVERLGLEYINIPVIWHRPTVEDAERFFAAMETNAERNVWVHCAVNMRVSTFCYLYRTLRLGMPEEEAQRDLHRIWRPEGWWAEYVQTVQAALGPAGSTNSTDSGRPFGG